MLKQELGLLRELDGLEINRTLSAEIFQPIPMFYGQHPRTKLAIPLMNYVGSVIVAANTEEWKQQIALHTEIPTQEKEEEEGFLQPSSAQTPSSIRTLNLTQQTHTLLTLHPEFYTHRNETHDILLKHLAHALDYTYNIVTLSTPHQLDVYTYVNGSALPARPITNLFAYTNAIRKPLFQKPPT